MGIVRASISLHKRTVALTIDRQGTNTYLFLEKVSLFANKKPRVIQYILRLSSAQAKLGHG